MVATQNDFILEMRRLVEEKTGMSFEKIAFKVPSDDEDTYNTSNVRGSINLLERRFMTTKKVDELAQKAAKVNLP